MERGINYIIIGLCFILSLIGLIIFIFWFSDSGFFKEDMKIYKSYTKRPLNIKVDSAIRYKGLGVGRVSAINFRDANFEEIEITLEILSELPVRKNSTIRVEQDGLLGGNYISLIQNENTKEIIEKKEDAILMISSDSIAQVLNAIPSLAGKVDYLLDSANEIVSEKNTAQIAQILESINEAAKQINILIKSLNKNTNEIESIIKSVNQITQSADSAIKSIENKIKSGEYDIKSTISPALSGIENAMDDLSNLAKEGEKMLKNLENNPYNTIFGYRGENE